MALNPFYRAAYLTYYVTSLCELDETSLKSDICQEFLNYGTPFAAIGKGIGAGAG